MAESAGKEDPEPYRCNISSTGSTVGVETLGLGLHLQPASQPRTWCGTTHFFLCVFVALGTYKHPGGKTTWYGGVPGAPPKKRVHRDNPVASLEYIVLEAVVTRGKASGVGRNRKQKEKHSIVCWRVFFLLGGFSPSLKVRANPMGNHAVDRSVYTASVGGVAYITLCIKPRRKCLGVDRYSKNIMF